MVLVLNYMCAGKIIKNIRSCLCNFRKRIDIDVTVRGGEVERKKKDIHDRVVHDIVNKALSYISLPIVAKSFVLRVSSVWWPSGPRIILWL